MVGDFLRYCLAQEIQPPDLLFEKDSAPQFRGVCEALHLARDKHGKVSHIVIPQLWKNDEMPRQVAHAVWGFDQDIMVILCTQVNSSWRFEEIRD